MKESNLSSFFLKSHCRAKIVNYIKNRDVYQAKHIDIKFLVVKERVQSEKISIEHIGTNSMIIDPFTKGLPPMVFHEHTAHMGVVMIEDISA